MGSERYGTIKNCASHGDISVSSTPIAQVAGIIGEFSSTYGGIGAAFGIQLTALKNCYASGTISATSDVLITEGGISGSGQPEPLSAWGAIMDYSVADCVYVAEAQKILADGNVGSLIRYSGVDQIEGTVMQSILDKGEGSGNWVYSNSLPLPNMTKK